MNKADEQYLKLGKRILETGTKKEDRTGTGTISITGAEMRFDLSEGFPLLTTKELIFRLIASETLWFVKGLTNIDYLLRYKNNIWNEWALEKFINSDEFKQSFPEYDMTDWKHRKDTEEEFKQNSYLPVLRYFKQQIMENKDFAAKFGELGRVYGAQWRNAFYVNPDTMEVTTIDPFKMALEQIKNNPHSRRIIVSSWNPDNYMGHAGLPCCHHQFQFIVRDDKLDLVFDMRSSDYFLGLPFNIAGYALLNHLVARETGYKPGEVIYHGKDIHVYSNHVEQVNEQLAREPKKLPTIWINPEKTSIFDIEVEDIRIEGYDPQSRIVAMSFCEPRSCIGRLSS